MENQERQIKEQQAQQILQPIVSATDSKEFLLSPIGQELKQFELMQRQAMVYCNSTIVPESYRGQQNIGNVIIGIDMAKRMGVNPLMVFQNLYVVYGNPGWSSKFLIGTFNMCGSFSPISYIEVGKPNTDTWGMKAVTTSKETGETLTGPLVTIGLAKSEGWFDKKGSKWKTIPELMLRYRSASWLINTVAPEISMGISTVEEIQDIKEGVDYIEVTDKQPVRKISFATEPTAKETKEEKTATVEVKNEEQESKPEEPKGKPTAKDLFGK